MKVVALLFILTFTFSRNRADRESGHKFISTNSTSNLDTTHKNLLNHTGHTEIETGKFTEGGLVGLNESKTDMMKLNDGKKEINNSSKHDDYFTLPVKETGSKVSSIKPRKGVNVSDFVSLSEAAGVNVSQPNVTSVAPVHSLSNEILTNRTKNNKTENVKPDHLRQNNSTVQKNKLIVPPSKPTVPPLKPTVTIYEDDLNPVPMRSSELSLPTNRPYLVLPILITVVALPVFAVLGYFALKHGREAWKNRHYRRMDFLLDGMYND